MKCVCVYWLYAVLYKCLSVRSMEYCKSLFVWELEVCARLVVAGVCVAEVRGEGVRCWGLCPNTLTLIVLMWRIG